MSAYADPIATAGDSLQELRAALRDQQGRVAGIEGRLQTPSDPLQSLRQEQQLLETRLKDVEATRTALQNQLQKQKGEKRKLRPAAKQPAEAPLVAVQTEAGADGVNDDKDFLLRLQRMAAERQQTVEQYHQKLDDRLGKASASTEPADGVKTSTYNPHQIYTARREKALVPAPFEMDRRESLRKACPSGTQRRRLEDQKRREEEEDRIIASAKRGPIANPVPPSTFLNRFEIMQASWVDQREAQRRRAQEIATRAKAPVPTFERERHYRRSLTTDDMPPDCYVSDGAGGILLAPCRVGQQSSDPPPRSRSTRGAVSRSQSVPGRGYQSVSDKLKKREPFRAREVPAAVKERKWQELCEKEVARRLRVKEQARYRYAELDQAPRRLVEPSHGVTTESSNDASKQPSSTAGRQELHTSMLSSARPASGPTPGRSATPRPRTEEPHTSQRSQPSSARPASASGRRSGSSNLTHRPVINAGVPNFPLKWEAERTRCAKTRNQCQKPVTEVQEFQLSQGSGLKSAQAVIAEIEFDERTLPETRWPQLDTRRRPKRRDVPDTNMNADNSVYASVYGWADKSWKKTRAEELRMVAHMKSIVDKDTKKRAEEAREDHRRLRERLIRERVKQAQLQSERERCVDRDATDSAPKETRKLTQEERDRRVARFAKKARQKVDAMLSGQPPIWLRTAGTLPMDEQDARAFAQGAVEQGNEEEAEEYSEKDVSGRLEESRLDESGGAPAKPPAPEKDDASKRSRSSSSSSS